MPQSAGPVPVRLEIRAGEIAVCGTRRPSVLRLMGLQTLSVLSINLRPWPLSWPPDHAIINSLRPLLHLLLCPYSCPPYSGAKARGPLRGSA
jgi:hypothetical protein